WQRGGDGWRAVSGSSLGGAGGWRRVPYLADRYLREVLPAAVNQVDDAARDEHRGEHRREDAEAVDHREAADRSRAEDQERNAGDQRRHVGIENRVPRALVARRQRRMGRRAPAQLLAYALVDQHVGVDRHAERKRDGGDARQGERRL